MFQQTTATGNKMLEVIKKIMERKFPELLVEIDDRKNGYASVDMWSLDEGGPRFFYKWSGLVMLIFNDDWPSVVSVAWDIDTIVSGRLKHKEGHHKFTFNIEDPDFDPAPQLENIANFARVILYGV